jgi:hypothetical protein
MGYQVLRITRQEHLRPFQPDLSKALIPILITLASCSSIDPIRVDNIRVSEAYPIQVLLNPVKYGSAITISSNTKVLAITFTYDKLRSTLAKDDIYSANMQIFKCQRGPHDATIFPIFVINEVRATYVGLVPFERSICSKDDCFIAASANRRGMCVDLVFVGYRLPIYTLPVRLKREW